MTLGGTLSPNQPLAEASGGELEFEEAAHLHLVVAFLTSKAKSSLAASTRRRLGGYPALRPPGALPYLQDGFDEPHRAPRLSSMSYEEVAETLREMKPGNWLRFPAGSAVSLLSIRSANGSGASTIFSS